MIPMRVREQQRQVQRMAAGFRQQLASERAQSRACIQNNDLPADAHLDAGGVAAITHRARARSGNRAAHAPKCHASHVFDETTLAGFAKEKIEIILNSGAVGLFHPIVKITLAKGSPSIISCTIEH